MFKSSFLAVVGAAVALVAFDAPSVHAQTRIPDNVPQTEETGPVPGQSRAQRNRNNRGARAAPPAPSAAETLAAAQAVATAAGLSCQATEASLLPFVAGEAQVYEATCATGPGYILIASTPPQAFDCVLLSAAQARLQSAAAADPAAAAEPADPAAATDIRCTLPQNNDILRVMVDYGREANLPCVPNEGMALGKQIDNEELYEVGCDGVDGYLLQRLAAGGFKTTECIRVVEASLACRFSTPEEQAASLKARFAGNAEAAACDVTRARYMGANANGSFYEAKCQGGDGVIVRFDPSFVVQQVYPCEVAQRIGGGCTMTEVPPLPEDAVVVPGGQ